MALENGVVRRCSMTVQVRLFLLLVFGKDVAGSAVTCEPWPDLSEAKSAAFAFAVALGGLDVISVRAIYGGADKKMPTLCDELAAAKEIDQRLSKVLSARFGKNAAMLARALQDRECKLR